MRDTLQIHYLAGTPRSGSTLLGNILAQHPDVRVTGTSPLYGVVNSIATALSNIPEVIGELENVPGSYERYLDALRAYMTVWHRGEAPVVIDKHRGWPSRASLVSQVDPESRIVAIVRDPRDIVASFIKQDKATALFDNQIAATVRDYASNIMSPEGMVGEPIRFIEDALRRKTPIHWVRFERLVVDPRGEVGDVAAALGLDLPEDFAWDFENVRNVATDLDSLYRHKYPHVGAGEVKAPTGHWSDVMSDELAAEILGVWPLYVRTFGYDT